MIKSTLIQMPFKYLYPPSFFPKEILCVDEKDKVLAFLLCRNRLCDFYVCFKLISRTIKQLEHLLDCHESLQINLSLDNQNCLFSNNYTFCISLEYWFMCKCVLYGARWTFYYRPSFLNPKRILMQYIHFRSWKQTSKSRW